MEKEKQFNKSELLMKYKYARQYLCYKIMVEDTKNLSRNTLIEDPAQSIIKPDKVLKNDSFHALKIF